MNVPLTTLLVRTYVRYAIIVTIVSAIAFIPLLVLAAKVQVPLNPTFAKGVVRTGWLLAGLGIAPMLLLVGGVAPLVASIANETPLSQLAALRAGIVGLAHALVPCAVAVLAILVGSIALVIPGLLLLVLLSVTGAFTGPLPGPLVDSVAAVRARIGAVTTILVASIAITFAGVYFLQRGLPIPLPKAPPPELYAMFRLFVRYVIVGVAIAAPVPAIALAAIAVRARPTPPA